MSMTADEVREALAKALRPHETHSAILDALLPTVQRIAYLRAAEEIRTVRQWLIETGRADADTLRQLRDRVDQIAAAPTGPEPRTDAAVGR